MKRHYGFLTESWEAAVREARQILISHARQRLTVTYGELSSLIQTVHIPHNSYAMSGLLRELHRDDVAAQRPGLATLVVRKSDRLPGPGYFAGLEDEGIPEADFVRYWQEKFDEICAYWQNHPDPDNE